MTSISKKFYIYKLDAMVNKYNNTYLVQLKWIRLMSNTCIDSSKEIKILNIKLLEYQNIKRILQKGMFQIGLKKTLWLKTFNILCHGHMLLIILTEKKLLERFTKKNCKKKKIKENLELKSNQEKRW